MVLAYNTLVISLSFPRTLASIANPSGIEV